MFIPPPIFKPDEVKGIVGSAERKPDRYFYLLDASHPGGERIWEADGWVVADGKTNEKHWSIILTCPLCENALKLDSTKKRFAVHEPCGLETDEPIQCGWEGEFADGGPCSWRVEFQDANGQIVKLTDGREVRLDAVIRRV